MNYQFITDEYMQNVVEKNPRPMNELGEFVYYRTYSRWLQNQKRREYWHETCQRAINYNMNLAYEHLTKIGLKPDLSRMVQEARTLFKNVYKTKQFLSGRTFWLGGANEKINKNFVLGNFNCSFINITSWDDLADLFYLLLVGTGVGFKSTKAFASKMPKIRTNVLLTHSEYNPLPKYQRLERTKLNILENGYAKILVGDSKEGWVESLKYYFELLTKKEYEHVHTIKISYNSVRPLGERLVTFGGTASGHEPLKDMFVGIDNVLKNKIDASLSPIAIDENGYGQVRPIHILDIGNLIGANVVVGGVRRTAEIFLFDADDFESMFAKFGINGVWGEDGFKHVDNIKQLMIKHNIPVPSYFDDLLVKYYYVYDLETGKEKVAEFTDPIEAEKYAKEVIGHKKYFAYPCNEKRPLHHRRMSNNSIAFTTKPSKEFLGLVFSMMKNEGEPGFINLEEAARRRLKGMGIENPDRDLLEYTMALIGLNPCAEILLNSLGVCNLTTVNVKAFVIENADGTKTLDEIGLLEAQRLSARIGLRMTLATLELPHWDKIQQRDRLLGTSLTGWKDAIALLGYSFEQEIELMKKLGFVAREEADSYAKELRVSAPLLVTTVKPEGTLSQVAGGVSSGLHWSQSNWYIRRIRINSKDPLAKVARKLNWVVNPEVGTDGNTFEEKMENARTWVIDFPIHSGATKTKDDVSVREQFDTYFAFQKYYTEHNSSNTITVRPDEWQDCENIVYENWDNFVGVSFLQLDGGTYQLAPYESISEQEYNKLKSSMSPFDVSVLHDIELAETEFDIGNDGCESGICPIR